jgi:hypothetical protein
VTDSGGTPKPGRRFDLQDLYFGLFLVAVAAFVTATTWKLRIGAAGNMGPGYMPRMLTIGILGFGLFFVIRGLVSRHQGIETPQLRSVFGITASVAVFGLLVVPAGLALASLATIVVAGFASRETKFTENLLFGGAMAAGTVLLFIKALNLPVAAWPW